MSKRLLVLLAVLVFTGSTYVPSHQVTAKAGGNDRIVEKRTFIHYRNNQGKPGGPGGGGGGKTSEGYYAYIASGLKWKTTPSFVYSSARSGLDDPSLVGSALTNSLNEWNHFGGDIFGALEEDETATYRETRDGVNTFTFANLDSTNIIAITNIWGVFSGPAGTREILEVDVRFNTDYVWGDAKLNPRLMDLQNIATHEIGHCAGMDDLYKPPANQETMFGYSDNGETIKRSLGPGDQAGIANLY
jgi:hypothetical protein